MRKLYILSALLVSPLWAQSIISTETRALGPRENVEKGRLVMDREQLRIDIGIEDGVVSGNSLIFTAENQVLYHVDHHARTYREISRESIAAMGARMQEVRKEMETRLASLPEDQQALMKKMIENTIPKQPQPLPERVLAVTTERRKISGFDCVRYDVLSEGEKKLEIWAADPGQVGVPVEQFGLFKKMSSFYTDVFNSMQSWSKNTPEQDPIGDFGKLKHFPILVRKYKGTKVVQETMFKDVEHTQLPPDVFSPPAAYEKLNENPAS